MFKSPKWIVLGRSDSIEATSHGDHQFPSQNAWVNIEIWELISNQISSIGHILTSKSPDFICSFFQQYALATSGIIFFEFTTMISLLAAAGTSIIIKVRIIPKFSQFFLICGHKGLKRNCDLIWVLLLYNFLAAGEWRLGFD